MADRYGYPTILEQKLRAKGRGPRHRKPSASYPYSSKRQQARQQEKRLGPKAQ